MAEQFCVGVGGLSIGNISQAPAKALGRPFVHLYAKLFSFFIERLNPIPAVHGLAGIFDPLLAKAILLCDFSATYFIASFLVQLLPCESRRNFLIKNRNLNGIYVNFFPPACRLDDRMV